MLRGETQIGTLKRLPLTKPDYVMSVSIAEHHDNQVIDVPQALSETSIARVLPMVSKLFIWSPILFKQSNWKQIPIQIQLVIYRIPKSDSRTRTMTRLKMTFTCSTTASSPRGLGCREGQLVHPFVATPVAGSTYLLPQAGSRRDSLGLVAIVAIVQALVERMGTWTVNTCRQLTDSRRKRGAYVIGRHEGRGSLEDCGVHARR